jgi:predicted acylesterase/phospholipase RssA
MQANEQDENIKIKMEARDKKFTGLALSCGSAGGYGQLGALHYFYSETDSMKDCKYFAGASVGAAVGCLLAIGFTPIEVFAELCTNDINEFLEINFNLMNLINSWGMVENHKFLEYIERLIKKRLGFIPTFRELFEMNGNTLITVSYCLSKNQPCYFNYQTQPDMPISVGVWLSCNIPILFDKAEYNGEVYIDGAVFDRCPAYFLKNYIRDEVKTDEFNVMVIDLFSPHQEKRNDIKRFVDYVAKVGFVVLECQKKPKSDDQLEVIVVENEFGDFTLNVEKSARLRAFTTCFNATKQKYGKSQRKSLLEVSPEVEEEKENSEKTEKSAGDEVVVKNIIDKEKVD